MNERARTAGNPALNRPGVPGLLDSIQASQTSHRTVNAVLVRVATGYTPDTVAAELQRWKHVQAFTRAQMEDILIAKLIATASRQIGMFLVILTIVSAAIVAFIIYTMTLGKIREIAVLKLIGTHNSTIASMILQQALGLGVIGFAVGKIAATLWQPLAAAAAQPGLATCQVDISSASDRARLVSTYPEISILVNNAGTQNITAFLDSTPDAIEPELHVNFLAPALLCHAFLPLLLQRESPAIVNVSSGLALVPKQTASIYCASKGPRGIRIQSSHLSAEVEALAGIDRAQL